MPRRHKSKPFKDWDPEEEEDDDEDVLIIPWEEDDYDDYKNKQTNAIKTQVQQNRSREHA